MTISRFFAQRSNPKKSSGVGPTATNNEGWETPVGLTKEAAICVDDGSDDEINDVSTKGTTNETGCTASVPDDSKTQSSNGVQSPNAVEEVNRVFNATDTELGAKETDTVDQTWNVESLEGETKSPCITAPTPVCNTKQTIIRKGLTNDAAKMDIIKEQGAGNQDQFQTNTHNIGNNQSQKENINPFLNFAFNAGEMEASYFSFQPVKDNISTQKASTIGNTRNQEAKKQLSKKGSEVSRKQKQRKRQRRNSDNSKKDEKPFVERSQEEQNQCICKWHSFSDEDVPVQVRRFQVLIAARLHCQAHEKSVRGAMVALRKLYSDGTHDFNPKYLCPETLAETDPEEIAKIISSVLFANVKSKQIVQAAKEIKMQFNSIVPETEHGMKLITGIGPKLAGLLYHVNSQSSYKRFIKCSIEK